MGMKCLLKSAQKCYKYTIFAHKKKQKTIGHKPFNNLGNMSFIQLFAFNFLRSVIFERREPNTTSAYCVFVVKYDFLV